MRFKTIIMAGAAAVTVAMPIAAPAHAEVTEQEDNYFVTRDTRVVTASPYETWAALIAPNRWWNDAHSWSGDAENMYLSAQAGGCFCELLPERPGAPESVRRGSARHMDVLQANPPLVLRMRGALGPLQSEPVDGVLTITLKPVDGGTRILFEYIVGGAMRFDVPVIAKSVDGVMSQQLAGLAKLLGEAKGAGDVGDGDEPASKAATDSAARAKNLVDKDAVAPEESEQDDQ